MDTKKHMKKQSNISRSDALKGLYEQLPLDHIDINKLVEKVWGWEYWIINCKHYCSKLLIVKRDHICSTHYHRKKHETFHILSGFLYMEYDVNYTSRTNWRMIAGDTLIVPQFTKHAFGGITEVKFLEISTQHFENDSYRDTKSRYVENGSKIWFDNSSTYVNKINGGNINE